MSIDRSFLDDLLSRVDSEPRAVLTELVAAGKGLPKTVKAMAYISIQTMPDKTVREITRDLAMAFKMYLAGDGSGILELAKARGIPPQFVNLIEVNLKQDENFN